jgi:alpha-N-acetylglucosamine transferase
MRFKRLKFFVAVALVMFILVVGSIIILGSIQAERNHNNPQQQLTTILTKGSQINPSPTAAQNQNQQAAPVQQPQVIFNPMIRTMAS